MTGWTAIIPFKPAGMRKTRLAERLCVQERDRLSELLFAHVAAVLAGADMVNDIVLLAREKPAGWAHSWIADGGRGLNDELNTARNCLNTKRLLVIHADLPFVQKADIAALTLQAEVGCAIAPDRHMHGTNAVALHDFQNFAFCFGEASLQRHVAEGKGMARLVSRPGLALDIDTLDDYEMAESNEGFVKAYATAQPA